MKTLTQGATLRATGLGFDEVVGLAGAAGILEAAAAGEIDDRGLRADGEQCARCGEAFGPNTPVRRTTKGTVVHDVCP